MLQINRSIPRNIKRMKLRDNCLKITIKSVFKDLKENIDIMRNKMETVNDPNGYSNIKSTISEI